MAKSKNPGKVISNNKPNGDKSGRDSKGHFIHGHKPKNGFDKRPQDINKDGRKVSAGMQFKKIFQDIILGTETYKDAANREIIMSRAEAIARGVAARAARESSADARLVFNYMLGLPMFQGRLELNPDPEDDELTAEQEAAAEAFLREKIMGSEGDGNEG